MSWITPRTWTATEVVTAAIMNTHVKGNMTALSVAVKARNSANIAAPSTAWTALTFDTNDYDIDNMHSTLTNSSRITCNTPGLYAFGGTVHAVAAGLRGTRIIKGNSSVNTYATGNIQTQTLFDGTIRGGYLNGQHTLSSGEWLTLQAYCNSTVTISALGVISPVFWAKWLSAT